MRVEVDSWMKGIDSDLNFISECDTFSYEVAEFENLEDYQNKIVNTDRSYSKGLMFGQYDNEYDGPFDILYLKIISNSKDGKDIKVFFGGNWRLNIFDNSNNLIKEEDCIKEYNLEK